MHERCGAGEPSRHVRRLLGVRKRGHVEQHGGGVVFIQRWVVDLAL
jgi:hypothetical protein